MKEVTFIKRCLYGNKGETRLVTDRAALQYANAGLIKEELEVKEEKEELETKEDKEVIETKAKKAKVTKAPKF